MKNYNTIFTKISAFKTTIVDPLKIQFLESINAQQSIIFNQNSDRDILLGKIPKKICGVYYFELKFYKTWPFNSGAEFAEFWKNSLMEGNSSKINHKRIPSIIEKEHWYPLYVGKREDLNSRITEHLYKPSNLNTYALRLNERSKLLEHAEIRFYFQEVCLFNKEYQSEIQYILTSLESEIRKSKEPWIGKQ